MSSMISDSLLLDHIHVGDCRDILNTLPERSVDVVFADPPYNLQLRQTLLRPNHSLVDGVDDEWDQFTDFAAYDAFTREWLTACRRVLKDTGTLWVIGSYHNIYRVGAILQDLGFWFLNDIVWVKRNPMPNFRGVRFTNAHETLLWCKKSANQQRYTFNYQLMREMNDDKQMRSDWELPLCTGSERLRHEGQKVHATQKPEALLYRVLLASTTIGDVVLDPFFGTGTSGAVAKKLGRRYIGIERDEGYAAAAAQRLAAIVPSQHAVDSLQRQSSRRRAARIPFVSLIEHGLVEVGQKLVFRRQSELSATVLANGALVLPDGQRGSIHRLGVHLSGQPSCNGWTSWFYETGDGDLAPIDDLREQVRSSRSE